MSRPTGKQRYKRDLWECIAKIFDIFFIDLRNAIH